MLLLFFGFRSKNRICMSMTINAPYVAQNISSNSGYFPEIGVMLHKPVAMISVPTF